MAYLDQYDLAQDAFFRKKISVAMAAAAVNVAGEAQAGMSAPKYSKRQRLAQQVLVSPASLLDQFAFAVVQNGAIVVGSPVAIVSSTSVYPSVVATATHGLSTGDTVRIWDHLVNTAANGTWTVTVLTATTFSIPVPGIGAGLATGRVAKLPTDSDIQFTINSVWDDMAGVTGLD